VEAMTANGGDGDDQTIKLQKTTMQRAVIGKINPIIGNIIF